MSIDYSISGRLAVNVLIDLYNLGATPKAVFDFINHSVNPIIAQSESCQKLMDDYQNWLPDHCHKHNCDVSKLEKLEITLEADFENTKTPPGMNDTREFTVHASAIWKASERNEEGIEISQIELIKVNFLKLRIPEY
jgi:hypothetical protein